MLVDYIAIHRCLLTMLQFTGVHSVFIAVSPQCACGEVKSACIALNILHGDTQCIDCSYMP